MNEKCSSVYSCFITQVFEWWYFKKYGTSFIEQVSLNHLSPLLGGGEPTSNGTNGTGTAGGESTNTATSSGTQQSVTGEFG